MELSDRTGVRAANRSSLNYAFHRDHATVCSPLIAGHQSTLVPRPWTRCHAECRSIAYAAKPRPFRRYVTRVGYEKRERWVMAVATVGTLKPRFVVYAGSEDWSDEGHWRIH
jgi:hypothetical protein